MKILNIGLDKSLVGGSGFGDAVERHKEYAQHLESLDIIVYTTKQENLPVYKISDKITGYPTNSSSKIAFIFDALKRSSEIHSKHGFDIVVAQEPYFIAFVGYLLKKKFGCKLQVNFHGDFWSNDYLRGYKRYLKVFSKFLVKQADGVRVVSAGIRDKLISAGIDEKKIALLPTPVNFKDFLEADRDEVEKFKKETRQKKIVLFAGRFTKEKNLEGFLSVFSQVVKNHPDSILVLVGGGPEEQRLKKKANEPAISKNVLFIGPMKPKDLAVCMSACTVFVLPSFTESLGKVLIEAALAEKPVVATKTTGALDIVVDGKTGFLVEIGDLEDLAQKIIKVLSDVDLAKNFGKAGKVQVMEKFNREKIVAGIIEFWKRLI